MEQRYLLTRTGCPRALLIIMIGTSFTPDDRVSKNLTGLIPHVLESLETQCQRALRMINSRGTPIDKYLYLSSLKQNNTDLFYTPTIGDVCLQYSTLYTHPEALYISIKQRKSIATILRNWPYPEPSICVVTDGSRILGLGDLGVNGVGIPVSTTESGMSECSNHVYRSASLPCTQPLLVSIQRRRCQSFSIVELPTRPIFVTRCISVFAKSECHLRWLLSSWTSSWPLSRRYTPTCWSNLRTSKPRRLSNI